MERRNCKLTLGDQVSFPFTIYEQEYFKNEALGDIRKCRQNTGRKLPPGAVGTVVSVHHQCMIVREFKDARGEWHVETAPVQWLVSVDFGDAFVEALRAESAKLISRAPASFSQQSY